MSRALRVLLVEDDDDDFVLFGAMARSLPGWTLERVATGDAALARDRCAQDLSTTATARAAEPEQIGRASCRERV